VDRRRLWLDLANAEYIRDTLRFPGCQIALRVDRDVIADDGTVRLSDTRYFVTSVDPGSIRADELLDTVRNHWQIENSVFFLKDRWWDEDRHWTRRPGLSEWLAYLTTAATMVLRIFCSPSQPLRAHADYINWSPCQGLEILGIT
jgi:predicted transposase YbfD/YdcC